MALVEDLRTRHLNSHTAVDGRVTRTGNRRRTRAVGRTTHEMGCWKSQRFRTRIEEIFGSVRVRGVQRHTRGRRRAEASFVLALAYNLIRSPRLLGDAPP